MAWLLVLRCSAQLPNPAPPAPIKGTFYISVDDAATIFVNGQKVYYAQIGESRSPELELKEGDHIVVELRNDTDGRHFIFLFASSDGNSVISFRSHDFKIVPDIGVTDFTPEQFQKWTKYAKVEKQKKAQRLPVPSASEFIWGDLDKCIIAGPITSHMISQKQR
jgi:hypothetical protein